MTTPAVAATPLFDSSGDPDVALMLRARDDDMAAFQELFRRHSEPLLRFVHRFVSSSHEAEDLTQEVFLRLYQARHRYEPRASFKSYLYRIATNLCLNETRRVATARLESFDGWPDDREGRGIRQFADRTLATAEEEVSAKQTSVRIREALDRLPANQRAALLLSRSDGFSCREVAETLETSESAVKSLIFRATRTLRDVLEDLLEAQGAQRRGAARGPGRPGHGPSAGPRKAMRLEGTRSA